MRKIVTQSIEAPYLARGEGANEAMWNFSSTHPLRMRLTWTAAWSMGRSIKRSVERTWSVAWGVKRGVGRSLERGVGRNLAHNVERQVEVEHGAPWGVGHRVWLRAERSRRHGECWLVAHCARSGWLSRAVVGFGRQVVSVESLLLFPS